MAPTRAAAKSRATKASKQTKAPSESNQDLIEEADFSADSEDMATLRIQRLAENMKRSVGYGKIDFGLRTDVQWQARKRREARRKAVEADFLWRSEKMEKQVNSAFEEFEK